MKAELEEAGEDHGIVYCGAVAVRESILEKATLQLIPGSRVGVTQTKQKRMNVPRQREKHSAVT